MKTIPRTQPAPELLHQHLVAVAPPGSNAEPPWGPSLPRRDDGPTVASGGPSGEQGTADSSHCAVHHQPEQPTNAKRLATLRAALALAGLALTDSPENPHGAFIAARWGLARDLRDLDDVAAFARRVGVTR